MQRDTIIVIIILIVIFVLGILAVFNMMNHQGQVTQAPAGATKLAFYNNGATWTHLDAIYENVTLKNGSIQTFYSEITIKPHSSVIVDLSNLTGYGNEKLPPGTNIRILFWAGLTNKTITASEGDLNLTEQGWSNTPNPGPNDPDYNLLYNNLTLDQLPLKEIDNTVFTDTDITHLHHLPGFIDDKEDEPMYTEELLTVDENGRVTIIFSRIPELCRLIAHIV